jgi:hypothetical protein
MMSIFDDAEVISRYPLAQAIKDGILVEVFKNRWHELSGGKPIVATAHLHSAISLAGLMEIWNEFVTWQKNRHANVARGRPAVSHHHEREESVGHCG